MASPTTNKGYIYPVHGGSVNAWDTPIDADFDQIDLNVGGYYPITMNSSIAGATFNTSYATISSTVNSATPASSIAQNLIYEFNGTINSSFTLFLPQAGGLYVVDNETNSSGTGILYVNTTGGTSAVQVPAGGSNLVYTSSISSNSIVVVGQFGAKLNTSLGAPAISATAGTVAGSFTDTVWDATNRQAYVCVVTGSSSSAVFIPTNPRMVPEGYLTLSTDPNNPILTADAAAATAVYYTPYRGNWTLISNGTVTYPYQFSQLSLGLTNSQSANTIYDVFLYNSTTASSVVLGTGPAWSNSAAGAGSRGTGAGTTQLSRLGGVWTNTVQATLTNGSTTYTCPANQGIYLGSILVDASAGQVSNYIGYGANRKWGVWNNYNRMPIRLKAGDVSANSSEGWDYTTNTVRISNASTANSLQVFNGLAEEPIDVKFNQQILNNNSAGLANSQIGVGWNSTNVMSGTLGIVSVGSCGAGIKNLIQNNALANYLTAPSIGLQQVYALEISNGPIASIFFGTEAYMLLSAQWRG